jgi:hypothetical protein
MSALGDAFAALKNVILLHERIEGVQKDVERLSGDLKDLNSYALAIDKRVVRIETMVEMTTGRRSPDVPRIEG